MLHPIHVDFASEFRWDEKKKAKTLVIEQHGRTVRQTGGISGNIVGDKGFSVGKHEWILEVAFDSKEDNVWDLDVVCCCKLIIKLTVSF